MAQLTELKTNAITVIGTLKTKELELATDRQGETIIKGRVTVEVKQGDKVNNLTLNVYNKRITKSGSVNPFFEGLVTVRNDYKALDDLQDGETADRVRVTGENSYNVYESNGSLRESNRLRASRFTRVGNDVEDSAQGEVDAVILGYVTEEINDEETGKLLVNAFTVGYGGRVNKLVNLKVPASLGMDDYFDENSTGRLSYDLLNYVVVKETPADESEGFGDFHSVVQSNSYVNELLITGGKNVPDGTEYEEDQIAEALKSLRAQKEEAKSRAAQQNNQSRSDVEQAAAKTENAFGSAKKRTDPFADSSTVEISDDDIPF